MREIFVALRKDRLYRTSVLLVADQFSLGALGGVFTIIATHLWGPRSIGEVVAVVGAIGLLVIAASLGMPNTIVAHLAGEENPRLFVRGALLVTIPAGAVLLGVVLVLPNHAGVPLSKLGLSVPWSAVLLTVFVVSSLVVAVVDPAFLALQKVEWSVGKDLAAMAFRFLLLILLAGTGTSGFFVLAVSYVSLSAAIDLVLLRWRFGKVKASQWISGFLIVRSHTKFAAGNQIAVLVAMLPTSLLPIIVLVQLGSASAAYVAIPLTVLGVLAIVPSMTAQSLFAEISAHPENVLIPVRKSLKVAYLATLPIAVVTILCAPLILDFFGHRYSIHGRDFLRWGAASSIFFCLNYVSDVVLTAKRLVGAYVVANVLGTIFVLLSLTIAVRHGLNSLGLGWFIGQGSYCAVSILILSKYVGYRNTFKLLRSVFENSSPNA